MALGAASFAEAAPPPQTIRVRIAEAPPVVKIRGFDLQIYEPAARPGSRRLAQFANRLSEWEIRCQKGRVRATLTGGAHPRQLELGEPAIVSTPAGFLH